MTYTPRYPRRPRGRHGKTWPLLRPESPSALDDLDAEHALLDLAERDGQRLLLAARLHQRPDVLEQALSELRVVSVDLPCALRGHVYQPVLAVHDVKEFVDRRVDDAVGDLVGLSACHVLPSVSHTYRSRLPAGGIRPGRMCSPALPRTHRPPRVLPWRPPACAGAPRRARCRVRLACAPARP